MIRQKIFKKKKAEMWWWIIGAVVALLALLFAGIVLYRSFTSGEAGTQSNMPCNPAAAEKKNCFDVVTKTYYGENGPVDASDTPGAGPAYSENKAMVTANTDSKKTGTTSKGEPNTALKVAEIDKEDRAYEVVSTFLNKTDDSSKIDGSVFRVYVREKNWPQYSWCVRTFENYVPKTTNACSGEGQGNYLYVELKNKPTLTNPAVEVNLKEDLGLLVESSGKVLYGTPVVMKQYKAYALEASTGTKTIVFLGVEGTSARFFVYNGEVDSRDGWSSWQKHTADRVDCHVDIFPVSLGQEMRLDIGSKGRVRQCSEEHRVGGKVSSVSGTDGEMVAKVVFTDCVEDEPICD